MEKQISKEEYYETRAVIRMLVRTREDFQHIRKAMDNRRGVKASGESQDLENLAPRAFSPSDSLILKRVSDEAFAQEAAIVKDLRKVLKRMPVYDGFLKGVKGVKEVAAGHICGAFDIYKAATVSKMWQYAGLNPGMVEGKTRVDHDDGSFSLVPSGVLIRGDKLVEGFVSPFNIRLRAALCGVMATGFIKTQNEYCMKYYYPMKERLANSGNTVEEVRKAKAKASVVEWKDAAQGHRHRAAIRYMVKMFVKDLYAAWRPLHGLDVRVPYAEEYLGKKHSS